MWIVFGFIDADTSAAKQRQYNNCWNGGDCAISSESNRDIGSQTLGNFRTAIVLFPNMQRCTGLAFVAGVGHVYVVQVSFTQC